LGNIADSAAVEALWGALNKTPEAGEALIVSADKTQARGEAAAARAIYQRLADQAKSKSVRAAAEFNLKPTGAAKPVKKKGKKKAQKKE
jgi:hypothetical protein